MLEAMKWEIIHIHNEPDSSLEMPTVEVLASNIEPKLANTIVRQLNQVCPLDNLRHVKRVQRRTSDGKVELSVILCLADEHEKDTDAVPIGIQPFIRAYNLCPIRTKVAKHAARSKEEWEEQCKIWPTSFHPSTNCDGVATLSDEDMEMIFHYMKVAIQQTKLCYSGAKVLNAAVIVDPVSRKVIASANDQTHPLLTTSEPSPRNGCNDGCGATTVPHESHPNTAGSNQNTTVQKFSLRTCSDIYAGVSCLNPWGWTAQELGKQNSLVKRENKFTWHPLRHAALVAIENAAERDRKLFPNSEVLELKSEALDVLLHTADKCPSKRQKIEEQIIDKEVSDNLKPTEIMRPYLCTGFDIYLVWEPCPMCAMALVHQRIRRIFYALPNPNIGALGSVYRLQGEKSLNHHYSVFRISVPEQDLEELILNTSDNTSSQC
ncbi:tRNA-specific adenosine deaminase TAD3-like [Curcuma longa]|uniref:tRNA-specific adenosine deaminase TAD3-like n=1 Tax=Curcuma longa TaxID=136217 RepID=UPI003D9F2973